MDLTPNSWMFLIFAPCILPSGYTPTGRTSLPWAPCSPPRLPSAEKSGDQQAMEG